MIERYTLKNMGKIWSDEYRFRKQLEVELAACRAWCTRGLIPKEDLETILKKADFANRAKPIGGVFESDQAIVDKLF